MRLLDGNGCDEEKEESSEERAERAHDAIRCEGITSGK